MDQLFGLLILAAKATRLGGVFAVSSNGGKGEAGGRGKGPKLAVLRGCA